jgi:exodeoxyribonuclease V gamma subunit
MPGLNLYTGNRLETLQQKLAQKLRENPLPPLEKEIVVVQSKGMQRWLNLEIARQNGICAHMEYLFPKTFVYNLFGQVTKLPETSFYTPEIMTWRILRRLPELMAGSEAESIENYVKNDTSGLKKYQLAEKIAAAFDRYIIMRPEMVTLWDTGKNPFAADLKESRWQAALWQMLLETETPDDTPLHHAALKNMFLATSTPPLDLPGRISIFGISTLPPFYIDIFLKIARQIDVDIYYLNPCREYWEYAYSEKQIARFTDAGISEDDTYYDCGNSLLSSMGSAGREFFSLVLNSVGDTGEDLFNDPGEGTLLASVQSDILNLRQRKRGARPPVADSDTSIRVHACHSRFREVEVLHDQLLNLFAENPDLLPTDIVVMMPDVTAYGSLIQAVFDAQDPATGRIPYSIADTHIRGSNALAEPFLEILTIGQKRYRAPAILDILETPAVRKRFGIEEQGLVLIKKWVAETGIHWGIDGAWRENLGLPGFYENSWRFGLERLLLGYALPPDDNHELFADILPYGEIEGDGARLLGAFTHFVQTLFAQAEALNRSRTLAQWAVQLSGILSTFFARDETTENDVNQIRDTLTDTGLSGYAETTGFNEPLSLDVIRAYLEKRIGREALSFGFISSGVTFCTLLPMRSIPFKVVYMLGLNDGDYPRTSPPPGFDLMAKRRQLCDWSKRHEDRYLFLESILSARQHLIISYVGSDPQDNSVRPPSVLVSELLDYLDAGFEAGKAGGLLELLITRHPLHPFSPRYFQGDAKLFSYSRPDCQAALASLAARRAVAGFPEKPLPAPTGEKWSAIPIARLCRFFNNPVEFLVKNRLQVNFNPRAANLPEEREVFELDALQAYLIKNDLVEFGLSSGDTEPFVKALQVSGRLPHGSSGELALAAFRQDAGEFIDRVKTFSPGEPAEPFEINVACGQETKITLQGTLHNLYPEGQLFYRCATLKAKDLLGAWIHHLLLNASEILETCKTTTVISKDERVSFQSIAGPDAHAELEKLTGYFLIGLQNPLCFFPETSRAFAEAIVATEKTVDQALQAAQKRWYSGYRHTGEVEDIYRQRSFGMEMPAGREFQETALDIFKPLFFAIHAEIET